MRVDAFVKLVAVAVLSLYLAETAQALPPKGNIKRNSLTVTSPTYRYRPQRPVVSPFLALAPNGVGTLSVINYFSIVQPQVIQQQINQQQGAAIQQLSNQVQSTSTELAEEEGARPRPAIGYMTQRKYFAQPLNHSLSGPTAPR
jgi:hypothetical protein